MKIMKRGTRRSGVLQSAYNLKYNLRMLCKYN